MEIRWDLSTIYDSFKSKALRDDISRVRFLIADTTARYETLTSNPAPDIDKIKNHINIMNELNSLLLKLSSYARMKGSFDEDKEEASALNETINNLLPSLNMINIPFLRYLNTLTNLDELLESDELLHEHSFIIRDLQQQAMHLLSAEMEELLGDMQETGSYTFEKLNKDLINSLMVDIHISEDTKTIPFSVTRNLAYAQSQEVRKAAYKGELKAYRKIRSASAACLNGIKGEAITIARARKFESPLAMTLADSRMTKQTLDAMFQSIIKARPHFRRYLHKKASLLGHEGALPFYDLYAPMGHFDLHFTYQEARNIIVKAFRNFSSDMADYADHAFEAGWIDMEPRDGKSGGAFCCNIHALKQSLIFINFKGTFYDLTLLAHELGHGYHYSKMNTQTILNTDYTMPMAEASSIICQTLVTSELLKDCSEDTRFAILENELLNYTQMLIEILARYTFETNVFDKRKEGALTVEEFNRLLLDSQEFAYGDGLSEERHKYMWICKPHYYFPDFHFYNFPYPFALLLSKGLFAMYEKKGESFLPDFEKLLSSTGCNSVEGVLRLVGVDSTDPSFYDNGMQLIVKLIDDFCALTIK